MIKIIILKELRNEIFRRFKNEAQEVYRLIEQLKENPNKGKTIGNAGKIIIKEIKYTTFRFYFIINGHELFLFNKGKIEELLIRFIRMSKKNNQQRVIKEIKEILNKIT